MAGFRIEINRCDNGVIGWQFHCSPDVTKDSDADTSELISVLQKLNNFRKELEAITSPMG